MANLTSYDPSRAEWSMPGVDLGALPPRIYAALYKLHCYEHRLDLLSTEDLAALAEQVDTALTIMSQAREAIGSDPEGADHEGHQAHQSRPRQY